MLLFILAASGFIDGVVGRVAQLVRALVSHTRGPGFDSLRDHRSTRVAARPSAVRTLSRPLSATGLSASAVILAALLLLAPAAAAQQPTPEQARVLLRTRPDLVQQLRQRIATSGLSDAQVRTRLRAEGYPEDLLDAILPGGAGTVDSSRVSDVFEALQELGIADSLDIAELVDGAPRPDRVSRDSIVIDSVYRADSLGRTTPVIRERRTPRVPARDSGFTVFGLDAFNRTSQFEANAAGPVDQNYRLGPGDRLVLILTGDVEASHALEVTREGFVVVPQAGQLFVNNLTLGELDDILYTRLGRVYSGVRRGAGATTRFSVSVSRLRSNQVYVLGDVARPGSYRVSSAGTALTALYAAGGPTQLASLRSVLIRRAGRIVDTLDLYDYLINGDATHDPRLQTGDVVFVPVQGARVRIVGEVVRPATYEIAPGETLTDAIRFAGGFTATAASNRVQIERVVAPSAREAGRDRMTIDVASGELSRGVAPAIPLLPGDLVRVFRVAERMRNRITVRGNVWAPGAKGFDPGMKLSDALRLAGGVKPDVYLGQVLVTRLQPDSTRVQLRAVLRDTTGAPIEDMPLHDDDEIQVFSLSTFRPDRFVAISGAVKKGGRFPYRSGMTLRDLVLLAGGLEESAYLKEAELARLPENRRGGSTAMTMRVPLDSSYVFERAPNSDYLGPPGLPVGTGTSAEVSLKPYDNVLILRQPDWELQRTVTVLGEIQFPGTYSLVRKSERLADLINRAGGLTTEGYAEGVYFTRKRQGRIGIDLPRVLSDSRFIDNLILQDGDSIVVPRFNAVVNVKGAVNSPVAVAYVPGQNIAFYIRAAGGPRKDADTKRSYVTQANGKVESMTRRLGLPDGVPKPGAGSVVVVPVKDPSDRRDYTAMAAAVAQVFVSLVAIVVVVSR